MTDAVNDALDDSQVPGLLRDRVQSVRVVRGIWPYKDPGRLLADAMGLVDVRTGLTAMGGNAAYDLVGQSASDISSGALDVAVLCSAETMRTRRRDRAAGRVSPYLPEREGVEPDEFWGNDGVIFTEEEAAVGMHYPVNFYALAEVANRHALGESVADHRTRVGDLWARGSAVAATNPDAWFQTARTGDEVTTQGPQNRPVAYPYPKLMTSNVNVDQSAAVIMCSAERAEALGVPRDRWVFLRSHAGAYDAQYMSNRWSLTESPAMRIAGARALELAGFGVDDCANLDLYSCFPVAVQMAQRELGIDADRDWTITGGLTFAGGPMNGYCMQALVRAGQLIREQADAGNSRTLLTGNGGFFSKHSYLVLDHEPGDGLFRSERPQAEVDALPQRSLPAAAPSTATVESYTAIYDRDGAPTRAVLACMDDEGSRSWATIEDDAAIDELLADDSCGRPVSLRSTGDEEPLAAALSG